LILSAVAISLTRFFRALVASVFHLLALELYSLKFITFFSLLKFSFPLLAVLKTTGIPTVNLRQGILPFFIIFPQFMTGLVSKVPPLSMLP
jgi:hypothetical protein